MTEVTFMQGYFASGGKGGAAVVRFAAISLVVVVRLHDSGVFGTRVNVDQTSRSDEMDPTHFLAQPRKHQPQHRAATRAEIDAFYQTVGFTHWRRVAEVLCAVRNALATVVANAGGRRRQSAIARSVSAE